MLARGHDQSEIEAEGGQEQRHPLPAVQLWPGVYNLLNKTRISSGKISESFWENVDLFKDS